MKRSHALIQHVGHAVRHRRKALGLSQVQFARLCGFSWKHLSKIERAQVESSISGLECLARGFGMNVSELFQLLEGAPPEANPPVHFHDQNLGRFVRRRREELGLSQAELGRLSGLSVKHLDHIERAKWRRASTPLSASHGGYAWKRRN
jgi:transcriptional regulator with XRE-family HTH domain